jgi:DNA gyrase subunit A
MVVLERDDATLLVATSGGMGKRSKVDAYRLQRRGGKGVINVKTTAKTGEVVAIKSVVDADGLMFITRNGVVNRQEVEEIRVIGRATQGVRLVNLDEGDHVMDVARVILDDEATDRAPRANGKSVQTADTEGPPTSEESAQAEEEARTPTEGEA